MAAKQSARAASGDDLEARLNALRADLRALQGDMRGLANGVGDAASERVAEMLKTTEDMASQLASDLEDWSSENVDNLRARIREQPLLACGIAAGAGMLLAALLRR